MKGKWFSSIEETADQPVELNGPANRPSQLFDRAQRMSRRRPVRSARVSCGPGRLRYAQRAFLSLSQDIMSMKVGVG